MARYIIIEKEWLALENLKTTIRTLRPEWQCIFTAESVEDTVRYFKKFPDSADLAFMDIELVDGNCFDIFTKVRVEMPIVFTTAYDNYAIKAFEVNSLDYILKPTTDSAVLHAIEKYERGNGRVSGIDYSELARAFSRQGAKRVLVSHGSEYSFIDVSDIAYFHSEDKCVFAVTFAGNRQLVDCPNLRSVEERMDPGQFFRVSRKVLVNINSITEVSKYFKGRLRVTVTAKGHTLVETVSPERREEFLNWLGKS